MSKKQIIENLKLTAKENFCSRCGLKQSRYKNKNINCLSMGDFKHIFVSPKSEQEAHADLSIEEQTNRDNIYVVGRGWISKIDHDQAVNPWDPRRGLDIEIAKISFDERERERRDKVASKILASGFSVDPSYGVPKHRNIPTKESHNKIVCIKAKDAKRMIVKNVFMNRKFIDLTKEKNLTIKKLNYRLSIRGQALKSYDDEVIAHRRLGQITLILLVIAIGYIIYLNLK